MITYIHDPDVAPELGGVYYPVVVCDACGRAIREHGNTYWLVLDNGDIHPQVWHTHKWPCSELDRAIRSEHGGGLVMSEELGRWLRQLTQNFRQPAEWQDPR